MGFRGINRSADRLATLPLRMPTHIYGGRSAGTLTPRRYFARRRGKSRSSAHLFHVPLTPVAYTLTDSPLPSLFSVGHAVRAPALAWHRRLRDVTLSRLTDSRPLPLPCVNSGSNGTTLDTSPHGGPLALGPSGPSPSTGVPLDVSALLDSDCPYSLHRVFGLFLFPAIQAIGSTIFGIARRGACLSVPRERRCALQGPDARREAKCIAGLCARLATRQMDLRGATF
jgi:hypothetical protein